MLVPEVLGKMAEMPEVAPAPGIETEMPSTSTVTLSSSQSNISAQVNRTFTSLDCISINHHVENCVTEFLHLEGGEEVKAAEFRRNSSIFRHTRRAKGYM